MRRRFLSANEFFRAGEFSYGVRRMRNRKMSGESGVKQNPGDARDERARAKGLSHGGVFGNIRRASLKTSPSIETETDARHIEPQPIFCKRTCWVFQSRQQL
jgi:hypothetical protein